MQGRWKPHVFKFCGKWCCVDEYGSLRLLFTAEEDVRNFYKRPDPLTFVKIAGLLGRNRQQRLNLRPTP